MQDKQSLPAPSIQNEKPEVKVGQTLHPLYPLQLYSDVISQSSSSRFRMRSGSIASAATIARSKALKQNAIARQNMSLLNTLNSDEQAAHLGTELGRERISVNTLNFASLQNLQQRLQKAAALYGSYGQQRKNTQPSQPSSAGMNGFFRGDPNRKLTPEQINQNLTMNVQGGTVFGMLAAISPRMNAYPLELSYNRAINAQMQQKLHMQQSTNMQASMQAGQLAQAAQAQLVQAQAAHSAQSAQAAHAISNIDNQNYVARASRAEMGMSVPQMSAFMVQPPYNENLRAVRNQCGKLVNTRTHKWI